jgi:hypothetical protein
MWRMSIGVEMAMKQIFNPVVEFFWYGIVAVAK